jgi:hypothetical protein
LSRDLQTSKPIDGWLAKVNPYNQDKKGGSMVTHDIPRELQPLDRLRRRLWKTPDHVIAVAAQFTAIPALDRDPAHAATPYRDEVLRHKHPTAVSGKLAHGPMEVPLQIDWRNFPQPLERDATSQIFAASEERRMSVSVRGTLTVRRHARRSTMDVSHRGGGAFAGGRRAGVPLSDARRCRQQRGGLL